MITLPQDWHVFDNADSVAQKTVEAILEIAKTAIDERKAFHLVTAGGTTPLAVYRLLAERETKDNKSLIEWSKWHIYMGDERCVPTDDTQRNSLALHEAWLKFSKIPKDQIHYMPAELGAEQAAKAYESTVSGIEFDVVLLGMGEDGHTASLFPGHNHEAEAGRLVQTEFHSPKPPPERVTLSQECLSHCRHQIKLVTGKAKAEAVEKWLAGEELPIAQAKGKQTLVFISQESLPQV